MERQQRDRAADDEHGDGAEAQQPDRQPGAILVKLESHEAVDEQASAQGRREAVLRGGEVWVWRRPWRDDSGIEDKRGYGEEHVDVEKCRDFFSSYFAKYDVSALFRVLDISPSFPGVDDLPTAVNFDRTWIIMIEVMTSAIMCIKSVAPWKMMVFASSTVRE